jgi:hypothetical protein
MVKYKLILAKMKRIQALARGMLLRKKLALSSQVCKGRPDLLFPETFWPFTAKQFCEYRYLAAKSKLIQALARGWIVRKRLAHATLVNCRPDLLYPRMFRPYIALQDCPLSLEMQHVIDLKNGLSYTMRLIRKIPIK